MSDPRDLWQRQPTEEFKMSADAIRLLVEKGQAKARQKVMLSIGIGVILCAGFSLALLRAPDLYPRIGWGMLILWCVYFVYQAYRWTWPGRAVEAVSVAYYRQELEERRDYVRHLWRRSGLTFCFLGLAVLLVPPLVQDLSRVKNAAPVLVLLLVWLVAYFPMRRRQLGALQAEIEELREYEG